MLSFLHSSDICITSHPDLYTAVVESMQQAVSELQALLDVNRLLERSADIVESAWSNGEEKDPEEERIPTVKSVFTPSSWR